jgi:hypothetical protein
LVERYIDAQLTIETVSVWHAVDFLLLGLAFDGVLASEVCPEKELRQRRLATRAIAPSCSTHALVGSMLDPSILFILAGGIIILALGVAAIDFS